MAKVPVVLIVGSAVAITAVAVIGYVGYRMIQTVSKIGTGENVKAAGGAVWDMRPKVIFKGLDNDEIGMLGGLV